MIATALRAEIERYAMTMRVSNPLFLKAKDGSLTPKRVGHYLANVHHLLLHTPPYLARARDRAAAAGDGALAGHYAHKLSEETGHDAWAEEDIQRVSAQATVTVDREVVPAMRNLVSFIPTIIDEDPALYLSYILFVEHLVVVLGPEWLLLLEQHCGIPRSSMTVIGNHAELDREHVEEALDSIDDLVGDPAKLVRMREVLWDSMTHFDRFCAEITQEPRDTRASRDASPHVSAA